MNAPLREAIIVTLPGLGSSATISVQINSIRGSCVGISEEVRVLPVEVQERLTTWKHFWWIAVKLRYILGTLGVLGATVGALNLPCYISQISAVLAATSIAALGFIYPEQQYQKFIGVWRRLEASSLKYRYGFIELEELLDEMNHCETMLSRFERDKGRSSPGTQETSPPKSHE
jgi:hypothetical protein